MSWNINYLCDIWKSHLEISFQNVKPNFEAYETHVPKSHYGILSLASRCMKLAFQISFQNIMLSHGQHSPKPRLEDRCTPKQHNVGMNKFMQHDSHFCDSMNSKILHVCWRRDIPFLVGYKTRFVPTQKVSIEKLTKLTPCNHLTTNVKKLPKFFPPKMLKLYTHVDILSRNLTT